LDKLDASQFRAFKSALTKEFVVVQGPPGTGKTFLGLKVATVLLNNAPVWNASGVPMLVVCYTNHALDQFLEGLVPVTRGIVRVGGQSKSELLQSLNLKEKRKLHRRKPNLFNLSRDVHSRMSYLMSTIKSIQSALEMITNHQGIVSLSALREAGII
jgi:Rad3-related DNA helicase